MSTVIRFYTNACLFNHRSKAFASKRWRHDWQHLLWYPDSTTSITQVPQEVVSFLTISSLGTMLTTILVDFDHRSKILPNWLLVDFDHRSKILHNWWNWSYQFRVGEKRGLTTILVDFDHRSKILPNWLLVDFDHRSKICSISETDLIRFMSGEKGWQKYLLILTIAPRYSPIGYLLILTTGPRYCTIGETDLISFMSGKHTNHRFWPQVWSVMLTKPSLRSYRALV